jgi:hypothetical protein
MLLLYCTHFWKAQSNGVSLNILWAQHIIGVTAVKDDWLWCPGDTCQPIPSAVQISQLCSDAAVVTFLGGWRVPKIQPTQPRGFHDWRQEWATWPNYGNQTMKANMWKGFWMFLHYSRDNITKHYCFQFGSIVVLRMIPSIAQSSWAHQGPILKIKSQHMSHCSGGRGRRIAVRRQSGQKVSGILSQKQAWYGVVEHACGPSYSEGRGRRSWLKASLRSYLEINSTGPLPPK